MAKAVDFYTCMNFPSPTGMCFSKVLSFILITQSIGEGLNLQDPYAYSAPPPLPNSPLCLCRLRTSKDPRKYYGNLKRMIMPRLIFSQLKFIPSFLRDSFSVFMNCIGHFSYLFSTFCALVTVIFPFTICHLMMTSYVSTLNDGLYRFITIALTLLFLNVYGQLGGRNCMDKACSLNFSHASLNAQSKYFRNCQNSKSFQEL